ncbi:unnamed protein product (macronuclear) [Paramecium tetraurelia]|uniref:Ribonuclease P/MRP protein subunit POP5 n=1 Tax=Paramecium tetraurelia TaxID=5888 RepID=A0EI78_PARTE|nr:uncharacterized protein GSPATT00027348001 [Paramecium tetraurelia]CAK95019.1 unnamed protein product [Paramecium tetraurelia]|eukprot:XP_001462392.1 hypothetical protein (macronuclear) [Paramecium tetraurelia strain d4-2]
MVRFKNRYFLCEYIQENQEQEFSERDLFIEIKDQVEYHFGQFGSGNIQFSFQVKYLNSISRLFILRVNREYKNIIWSTLLFMNMFRGVPIKIRTLSCSGTINKCEIRARRLLTKWVHKILKCDMPNRLRNTIIRDYQQTQQILPKLTQ